jgi:hypothetical protein
MKNLLVSLTLLVMPILLETDLLLVPDHYSVLVEHQKQVLFHLILKPVCLRLLVPLLELEPDPLLLMVEKHLSMVMVV